jgi:glycosyl transferase family 87
MSAVTHHLPGESRETIRALSILGAFFFVAAIVGYLVTLSWSPAIPRDGTTLVIGRDFLNFWMYGRAAFTPDPSRFYDLAAYHGALDALLGPGYPGQNWSYPPSIFFVAAPFGWLTYLQALLVWIVLGAVLFVAAVRAHISDKHLRLALVLSPAAVLCVISGQSSLITAAMLVTIFFWLDRRPIAAGILIGLLTLKPQLGMFLPVMLIASGRWRVFASAAVTTLVLASAAALVFGPQVWIDFVAKGLPTNNLVLADPERIATPFYPTVFMNLRGLNLTYGAAMAVQLCFTAFAVAAIVWAFRFRRDADPMLLMALFLACAVGGTPYLLSYDTLAVTFAALLLLERGALDATGRRLVQLVYWLPLIQIGLGNLHVPGPALIAPAFALYALMRLRASPAAADALDARCITAR